LGSRVGPNVDPADQLGLVAVAQVLRLGPAHAARADEKGFQLRHNSLAVLLETKDERPKTKTSRNVLRLPR
jgi:hypothetical protein